MNRPNSISASPSVSFSTYVRDCNVLGGGRRGGPHHLRTRWPPARRQQQRRPDSPGGCGDEESLPHIEQVAAFDVVVDDHPVDRPSTAAERAQRECGERDEQDVLVALAGPEDEVAVLQVVGDQRDEHHAQHAGRRQRRQQPEKEQRRDTELGQRREQRMYAARPDADRLEPTRGARQLAATERVVVAVRQHRDAEDDAQQQRADVQTVPHAGPSSAFVTADAADLRRSTVQGRSAVSERRPPTVADSTSTTTPPGPNTGTLIVRTSSV